MRIQITSSPFIGTIVVVCILASNGLAQRFNPRDLGRSAADIIRGLGTQAIREIPTPQDLLYTSIQLLVGLPEQTVVGIINQACSLYLASGAINPRITPNIEEMYYQLRTPCKNISVPLQQPEQLVNLPEFDVNKQVVIFVSGWGSDANSSYIQDFANAYNCRGDYNFVYIKTSDSIKTLYTWSAFNTEEVGDILAESLSQLTEYIPVENIHLIGHSLGGQIVGSAGRQFKNLTGQLLPRITGLDPANPCFNEGESLEVISRGDAEFVDIVHSNPGVLGKPQSLGDVDFYPNGKQAVKPGCVNFGCSHERSIRYFIETVYPGNERNFLAKRCNSLSGLNGGRCDGPEYPMGYAVPHDLKGDYYLNVNAEQPYGKNAPENATVQPNELCAIAANVVAQSVDFSAMAKSAASIIEGFGSQGSKQIPTPSQMFSIPVQVLIGFPEQVMFGVLNRACE
ncbi:vitellogenin-1-like [Musca vetustissima]|uniref:vitellogenin-1-like n=1 Tax=Musca vetustissima TaxID=27455 RepID=UPI002AB6824B|nr:vitellogenin-1-like [Musca vetustissima]